MKKKKRRKLRRITQILSALFLTATVAYSGCLVFKRHKENMAKDAVQTSVSIAETTVTSAEKAVTATEVTEVTTESEAASLILYPERNENTVVFGDEYDVKNAILINVDDNVVIARKNERYRMYPASLTKVMTLIVAVENIENMHDKVLITDDMITPYVEQDASRAGFLPDETPSVKDLLYGMVLNSGADAALAVAEYVAGSEEKFVELMNIKGEELGLYATHFTNVVGLHNSNHYSTAEDMAVILEYAIRNETCRKILSTEDYEVAETEQNPDGLVFKSTLFSRMYGDEMPGITIKGGKTGYTDVSRHCVESFAVDDEGKTYILVLCGSTTKWNAIYDTLSAYSVLCVDGEPYSSSRSRK